MVAEDRIFEQLEGYLDGEQPAPAELATDPEYQRVYEELVEIRQRVRSFEPPPMSDHFTTRVLDHVALQGRSPLKAWWSRLWSPDWHPIAALLQTQAREFRLGRTGFLTLLLLFGLPGAFMGALETAGQVPHEVPSTFLWVASYGLMALLPLFFLTIDVATISKLKQGRCIEDLRCAGIPLPKVVDTLALFSLKTLLTKALPAFLGVALGVFMASPEATKGLYVFLSYAPLAGLLLAVGGSYIAQFFFSWQDHPRVMLGGGLLLASNLFLFLIDLEGFLLAPGPLAVSARLGAAFWVLNAVLARHLTIKGLRLRTADSRPRTLSFVGRVYEGNNPILLRQALGRRRLSPGRRAFEWLLAFALGASPVIAYGPLINGRFSELLTVPAFLVVLLLPSLVFLVTALRAAHLLTLEKTGQSWETLRQALPTQGEAVRLLVGATVYGSLPFFLPLAAGTAIVYTSWSKLALIMALWLSSGLCGALVGVASAWNSNSLGEAGLKLARLAALGAGQVGAVWALATTFQEYPYPQLATCSRVILSLMVLNAAVLYGWLTRDPKPPQERPKLDLVQRILLQLLRFSAGVMMAVPLLLTCLAVVGRSSLYLWAIFILAWMAACAHCLDGYLQVWTRRYSGTWKAVPLAMVAVSGLTVAVSFLMIADALFFSRAKWRGWENDLADLLTGLNFQPFIPLMALLGLVLGLFLCRQKSSTAHVTGTERFKAGWVLAIFGLGMLYLGARTAAYLNPPEPDPTLLARIELAERAWRHRPFSPAEIKLHNFRKNALKSDEWTPEKERLYYSKVDPALVSEALKAAGELKGGPLSVSIYRHLDILADYLHRQGRYEDESDVQLVMLELGLRNFERPTDSWEAHRSLEQASIYFTEHPDRPELKALVQEYKLDQSSLDGTVARFLRGTDWSMRFLPEYLREVEKKHCLAAYSEVRADLMAGRPVQLRDLGIGERPLWMSNSHWRVDLPELHDQQRRGMEVNQLFERMKERVLRS